AAVEYREAIFVAVEYGQALARVAQPHSAAPRRRPQGVVESGAIVYHADFQHFLADAALDADHAPFLARRYSVLQSVLYKWLQQQTRHEGIERRLLYCVLQPQAIAEAQALRAEVEIERLDFLAQCHALHRILIERVAEEFRETHDRAIGGEVLVVEDQRR